MIEETLVLIKPDGVKRSLIGEIISRFEKAGMQIAGLKLIRPAEKQLNEHYLLSPEWVSGIAQKTREAFAKKGIEINETDKVATVTVALDQQSLAIGKGGQNVRLAAKLTGWKIDIRSAKGEELATAEVTEDNK